MSKGTLFTRLPAWIRAALAAQEPDVPNQLGGVVDPVLDVGQGGWGTMVVTSQDVSAAAGTNIVDVYPEVEGVGYFIFAVHMDGGAAQTVGRVSAIGGGGVTDVGYWQRTLAAGFSRSCYNHEDSGSVTRQGMPMMVIPPNWGIRVQVEAPGGGNSATVRLLVGTYRQGFKVW